MCLPSALAVRLCNAKVAINLQHFAPAALCTSDQPARHFLDLVGRELLQLEFMQVNRVGEGIQFVEVHGAGVPGAAGAAACKVGFACGLCAVEMFGQAVDDAPAFYLLGHLDSAVHNGCVHLGGCAGADLFEAFAHGSMVPELVDGYHFITALMEVGSVSYAGMDLAPISWPEIAAWQQATRCPFRPHELQLLRSLSAAYLEQYRLSKSDACPSPEIVRP